MMGMGSIYGAFLIVFFSVLSYDIPKGVERMKRIVTMQDLSCLGKCSLTVVLPVISAMGVECAVLPTAVLSTHTAFLNPAVTGLDEFAARAIDHWTNVDASFDGILTGYLATPGQAELAAVLIDRFAEPGTLVVCDPAMGDHGKRYSGIGPEMVEAHRKLCDRRADLILPNATEAALLTGISYRENPDEGWCREAARELCKLGRGGVLLTGLEPEPGKIGFFWTDGREDFAWSGEKQPQSCHGTGDLFAAVVMGAMMGEKSAREAGVLAAEFVARCIDATEGDSRRGVAFERQLGWLIQQI